MKKNVFSFIAALIMILLNATGQNTTENKQIFLTKEFTSLSELLSQFHGDVVYIDFWASWCSPCLNELKHDAELDDFFEKNKIIRLYIAVERKTKSKEEKKLSINKWKTLVNNYNLTGYNYYTQKRSVFMNNVYKNVMGKLSLPRFVIVNKKGEIIVKKAKKPSQKKKLIKQLTNYLNKNR